MKALCACGVHLLDPENATFVRNGVPLCHEETCTKVREHRNMRRVPFFDEEVRDTYEQTPEPYARSNRYGDI